MGNASVTAPEVAGLITSAEVKATAEAIAEWQLPSGMIPWTPNGQADAWNHTEAAMALSRVGLISEAEAAYSWLEAMQRPDGSWHQYYLPDRVKHHKLDANVCAYVAAGVWYHYALTNDRGFLETMWRVVEPAIDFVLDLQTQRGEILWARHTDGTPWPFALLTGSSSIAHSIRCAISIAHELGHERPDWELSAARLAHVIRSIPEAFEPKERWAMDWYYPVLAGVVTGEAARQHLAQRYDQFVMEGKGIRCVHDRPWITVAETCEGTMAHLAAGEFEKARELFSWIASQRTADGRYWTGTVYPDEERFPAAEQSTYTAAAVVLAADALDGTSAASTMFTTNEVIASLVEFESVESIESGDTSGPTKAVESIAEATDQA